MRAASVSIYAISPSPSRSIAISCSCTLGGIGAAFESVFEVGFGAAEPVPTAEAGVEIVVVAVAVAGGLNAFPWASCNMRVYYCSKRSELDIGLDTSRFSSRLTRSLIVQK